MFRHVYVEFMQPLMIVTGILEQKGKWVYDISSTKL